MNKKEYLEELEKALRLAHVRDSADIMEEYTEHFERKQQDGYSEEEIAARLAPPKDLASQFANIAPVNSPGKSVRIFLNIGLIFWDIFAGTFFILMYAWVLILGAFSVATAGLGIMAVTDVSLWNLIPEMPYICAFLLGFMLVALAVLSAIGTEYCRLYVTQLLKVYVRWHKTAMGGRVLPPLAIYPPIKAKKRRVMRNIALISLVIFAICFVAGMGSTMIAAKSLEPWHVWHWFQ